MLHASEATSLAPRSLLKFLLGDGWLFARPSRTRRLPSLAMARAASRAPFSRALSLHSAVLPTVGEIEPSRFAEGLAELDMLRGWTASVARRRELLDALGATLFARMRMHRELFRPQWMAAGNGERYDARFRAVDAERDRLFTCRVEGEELVAVIERPTHRAAPAPARTVRFPLRFLADDGESRMWQEASQRLRRLRVEREEANARFVEAETQVQALLERYSAAVA
ncbi:MAG: hypothetical protein J7549_05280 [Variovorax sp.]|nr:hypothetical protein [Variovorax sp.]